MEGLKQIYGGRKLGVRWQDNGRGTSIIRVAHAVSFCRGRREPRRRPHCSDQENFKITSERRKEEDGG